MYISCNSIYNINGHSVSFNHFNSGAFTSQKMGVYLKTITNTISGFVQYFVLIFIEDV